MLQLDTFSFPVKQSERTPSRLEGVMVTLQFEQQLVRRQKRDLEVAAEHSLQAHCLNQWVDRDSGKILQWTCQDHAVLFISGLPLDKDDVRRGLNDLFKHVHEDVPLSQVDIYYS